MIMYKVFIQIKQNIVDFIFPPNIYELELRTIDCESVFDKLPICNISEFPFIKSIFLYKNPLVRELIWQIKYKKNKQAIDIAGYVFYKKILELYDINIIKNEGVLLIPIPISNERRKERGFNQCELIIDSIKRYDIENYFRFDYKLLKRISNIDKQTFKNRKERIENARNIFAINNTDNTYNKNINIILIDDVSTTGSTFDVAREIFKTNSYENVYCLSLAH